MTTTITRLRLDAALSRPAPPRKPGTLGRPQEKGARLPTLAQVLEDPNTCWQRARISQWHGGKTDRELDLATGTAVWYHPGKPALPIRWVLVRDPEGELEPKAFLSTNLALATVEILSYFVRRWQIEVTFEEVRRHPGVGTQRQWSDLAIARTTLALLGLFSIVALAADQLQVEGGLTIRTAAWYEKADPTFSEALASLRCNLWRHHNLSTSASEADTLKIPRGTWKRLTDALAYAA